MKKLFVSYSREDENRVVHLCKQIASRGFDIWIDKDNIRGGRKWKKEIVKGIQSSDFFILMLSRNSIKSDYVQKELDVAEEFTIPIIPVKTEEGLTIPDGMILQTAGLHWIELFSIDNSIQELIDALEIDLEKEKPIRNGAISNINESLDGPFVIRMTKPQFERELDKFVNNSFQPILLSWRILRRRKTEKERKEHHLMNADDRQWEIISNIAEADAIKLATKKYRGIVLELTEKENDLWIVVHPEGNKESITVYEDGLHRHMGFKTIPVDPESLELIFEWLKNLS